METLHEYAFDCTLTTSLRVKASSREEAENHIRACMDSADCNGGLWPRVCKKPIERDPKDIIDFSQVV